MSRASRDGGDLSTASWFLASHERVPEHVVVEVVGEPKERPHDDSADRDDRVPEEGCARGPISVSSEDWGTRRPRGDGVGGFTRAMAAVLAQAVCCEMIV